MDVRVDDGDRRALRGRLRSRHGRDGGRGDAGQKVPSSHRRHVFVSSSCRRAQAEQDTSGCINCQHSTPGVSTEIQEIVSPYSNRSVGAAVQNDSKVLTLMHLAGLCSALQSLLRGIVARGRRGH